MLTTLSAGSRSNTNQQFVKSATNIGFRINLHLRHVVIVFHVLLPNGAAVANGLYTLTKSIGANSARFDGSLRHKGNGGRWVESLESEDVRRSGARPVHSTKERDDTLQTLAA